MNLNIIKIKHVIYSVNIKSNNAGIYSSTVYIYSIYSAVRKRGFLKNVDQNQYIEENSNDQRISR